MERNKEWHMYNNLKKTKLMWLRDSSSTGSAMKTFHITQQQLALITQLPKDKQCQPRNSANVLP